MRQQHKQSLGQLQTILSNLKRENGNVAVVGIGAELRGDDYAGVLAAQAVAELNLAQVRGIIGASAPENITKEIIDFAPALTVFVDAANLGLAPGDMRIIEASEIKGVSFSTHTLPLYLIIDYLSKSIDSKFMVVGIEPKSTEFLIEPSEEIREAVAAFVELFEK